MLPLWIDMISINQEDAVKKASQIPLMKELYSRSRLVFIWIHEYDQLIRYAFHYIRHMLKAPHPHTEKRHELFDPLGWDAIRRLCSCAWFHRRWTVQEAVIPKHATILCGPEVMAMDDVFSGVDIAVQSTMSRPSELKSLKFANTGQVRALLLLMEVKRLYVR